jgi:hypothetical protein
LASLGSRLGFVKAIRLKPLLREFDTKVSHPVTLDVLSGLLSSRSAVSRPYERTDACKPLSAIVHFDQGSRRSAAAHRLDDGQPLQIA